MANRDPAIARPLDVRNRRGRSGATAEKYEAGRVWRRLCSEGSVLLEGDSSEMPSALKDPQELAGYISKRRAEQWLAETLRAARHGELSIQNSTGVRLAEAGRQLWW
jgi:hypothetical protein